jgi:hypothetical protein
MDLFAAADVNKDGALSLEELCDLFKNILPEYPHLRAYMNGINYLVSEVCERVCACACACALRRVRVCVMEE